MVAKILSSTIIGLDARLIEVEVDAVNGLPATIIVGLAGTAVQESRERVKAAIKNSGLRYPLAKVSVNLAPAHLPKIGTRFDLPIALGILSSSKQVRLAGAAQTSSAPALSTRLRRSGGVAGKSLFIGELSLDGGLRPVTGVVATVLEAKKQGCVAVFVPAENWEEAALVEGIAIYPVASLGQLIKHFSGQAIKIPKKGFLNAPRRGRPHETDFKDIAGQGVAKRALEIAAAGGHNVCLVGPPGTGKTMLARAMPGIMPPLSKDESLEVAKIYSISGNWPGTAPATTGRPFRSPHHTASYRTIIGGGNMPQPGEVTLAHRGVLFLDELPEFSRPVLEALREPLEERQISLTRSHYTVNFPTEFLLVAAFNPCPCGYSNDGTSRCQCSALTILRYQRKLSGPFLDRIDLRATVPRVSYGEMAAAGAPENSDTVQARVMGARGRQHARYGTGVKTNATMAAAEIKQFCVLDRQSEHLLRSAAKKYHLSGRGVSRILKVARTIADLAGNDSLEAGHVAEALHYRLGRVGE